MLSICYHLPSIGLRFVEISHFDYLLWNSYANWNQTLQECSRGLLHKALFSLWSCKRWSLLSKFCFCLTKTLKKSSLKLHVHMNLTCYKWWIWVSLHILLIWSWFCKRLKKNMVDMGNSSFWLVETWIIFSELQVQIMCW